MARKGPMRKRPPNLVARNRDLTKTLLQDKPGERHYGWKSLEATDTQSADAWMRQHGHSW